MEIISKIRSKTPLVHCITNYVTVNDVANALLSLGASPVMADDEREVEEMVGIANALVINIGTLNERTINAMIKAGKRANELGYPVVLDPVGIGATQLRTDTAFRLLESVKFSVIRANISEAGVLAGLGGMVRGVDASGDDTERGVANAIECARVLSSKSGAVVAISGKTDVIASNEHVVLCENGHQMMSRVTGSGCMLSAVLGAFVASDDDVFNACVSGVCAFGVAGEMAYDRLVKFGGGNASYRNFLIDALGFISDDELVKAMIVSKI